MPSHSESRPLEENPLGQHERESTMERYDQAIAATERRMRTALADGDLSALERFYRAWRCLYEAR